MLDRDEGPGNGALPRAPVFLLAFWVLMHGTVDVYAHGGLGHIQVMAWGVENLPNGKLREFLADPEIFNSTLFGAAYPDIGYYPFLEPPSLHHAYGEYSHWSPFISEFVEWIKVNDPPPWTSLESRKRVAFLLGCAVHGFQDEIFDSLFLPKVVYHDREGQEGVDGGTDGLLVRDGLLGMVPSVDAPVNTLVELYNQADFFDGDLSEDQLSAALETMGNLYIHEEVGPALAELMISRYEDVLLWTADNYMNPGVPGSLHSEIFPTARLIEAMWDELHGKPLEQLVAFEFPEVGWRLRSSGPADPGSWVTFLFSTGVDLGDVNVQWSHSSGEPVEFSLSGTAWGGQWPRVLRLMPVEGLASGEWYSISLEGGVTLVSGVEYPLEHVFSFQVDCDEPDDMRCASGDEPVVARLDGAEFFRGEWGKGTGDVVVEPGEGCGGGCSGLWGGSWLGVLVLVAAGVRWRLLRRI